MNQRKHSVTVRVGSKVIEHWTEYRFSNDILQPADDFSLTIAPVKRAMFELLAPDEEVEILLDDTTRLVGYIDSRSPEYSPGGSTIAISGRDKGGRLLDESMPLLKFEGLGVLELAKKVCDPWYSSVSLSNARNRRVLRGKGARIAGVSSEPPIFSGPRAAKKVNPGETRWQVLAAVLEEAELIGWGSGDGREFVVGLPNYNQEPQFRFFNPKEASRRVAEGNVERLGMEHSVGERYSKITVCGAGRGNSADYGSVVTKRKGVALNNPADRTDGVGKDFRRRKQLIISDDDIRSMDLAQKRAVREMAERDSTGHRIRLTVKGHAQVYGGRPVLYAPDLMAEFEDEETGIVGTYLITSCAFSDDRSGERTEINLVPKGTVLKL